MPEFVSIADRLHMVHVADPIAPRQEVAVADDGLALAAASTMAGLQLLKLAAAEAYERGIERALARFVESILARELQCAPVDIEALATQLLEEFSSEEPIALIVAPQDAMRIGHGFPVRVDPSLQSGDLCVDVRDGTIDARFVIRCGADGRAV